ncbi:MAG: PAS domain-containing sensor histidine kinase [Acidobacteriota bacterium]|nr:PAS domain-containing sensor histidine kinase [Acidobacteriota bacterium]
MTGILLRAGKSRILAISLVMIASIAIADRAVGDRASLGLFYMLPMVIAASVLRPWQVIALALLCSALRSWFDIPVPELEALLRFPFAFAAYSGAGLLAIAISSVRREQELRREAEEQLRILVESSPAAIVTLDENGYVLAANRAADNLLMLPAGQALKGRRIARYLPVLMDALQFRSGPEGLRTSAQCQGLRENGEIFLADTWISSWQAPEGRRLAAIVVDASEEMRDHEEENLRMLTRANQIAAAAISHEVRNLCSAISVVSVNLLRKAPTGKDDDVEALASLARGLEAIASSALSERATEELERVPLRKVLDDLRIVIDPQWREIGGAVRWNLPLEETEVLAESHGLLQAFLNLAQNSHRAVQNSEYRELRISARSEGDRVVVSFEDTGPGVASPERLFAPFQPGADGTGLGLYVSRSVIRGFGGDLRYSPNGSLSRFVIELQR